MPIGELCRACLSQMESFSYYLLDNVPSAVYTYCTTIEIKQEENLPRALCNICYNLLIKFFDFKQKCIQSQNTLLNYNFIKPEVEVNYEVHISNKNIKSESTFIKEENTGNIKLLSRKKNTNPRQNSKNSVETDNLHCSDDDFSNKDGFADDLVVKQEHVSICVGFHDGYTVQDLAHQPIIKGIKKNRIKKRKRKNGIVKATTKLKEPKEYFNCDLCEKIFYSPITYQFHKLSHTNKEVKCTTCTKMFVTLSGLRRHLQSCHTQVDLKYLKCDMCGKISKSKEALKMHVKIHKERKLFFCDTCGKSCTTSYSFKAHLETHKENRERRFTCEHCGKKFYTSNMLISHVSRGHTGRRYVCDICSYPFKDKSNLAKHIMLLHEGKKLYNCNICLKSFAAKSSLVEHERIHSGERPFACNYCPKSFLSKRRLTDHHRIHTGEKPYKCDVCDQAFTQCGTLNRHMKVHERNVPIA